MIIGRKEFDTKHHTYIMGILNVTPDSFSDGGKYNRMDAALSHAQQMISEGADIVDVGGESTRPGHEQISDEEEIERAAPVIEALKREFDIPVSIDTYKSRVASAALEAGADLVNDIWGLKYDEKIAARPARSLAGSAYRRGAGTVFRGCSGLADAYRGRKSVPYPRRRDLQLRRDFGA